MASFSVILPTISRPTLARTISSVIDQLEDADELIVVGDGRQDDAANVVESFQPASLFYVEAFHHGSVYGNAQRTFAMQLALGRSSHLIFIDDDDRYRSDALDIMRYCIGDDRSHAHIFRARWGSGHHAAGTELWADHEVREGNFGTPQVVLPNRPYSRSWMDSNDRGHGGTTSDYGFLSAAIAECEGVRWHKEFVAVVRP